MTAFKFDNMEVLINFATPLCSNFLDLDNEVIADYCYNIRSQSDVSTRPGGWQSGSLNFDAIELQPLVQEVSLMIAQMNGLYQLNSDYTFRLHDAWININEPGQDQLPNNYYHLHPNKTMSFVYYVKAEENAGNLVLVSPNQMLEYNMPDMVFDGNDMFNSARVHVPPVVGKLVAFPSWVIHFAEPNLSNSDRISIAFNTILDNR